MTPEQRQQIIEAALLIADEPLTLAGLARLFEQEEEKPANHELQSDLTAITARHAEENPTGRPASGVELVEVASGYRFQAKAALSFWLAKLWEERSPRYSRAFLETLAIIAYKQPITRAEIEEIRGVTVNSTIIKSLQDREWIRIIGYREVPGRPAIYATTKIFLDYFKLKSLTELPPLATFKPLLEKEAELQVELAYQTQHTEVPEPEAI